jgi:transcriptional regulator with XRE-family HTH domain
MGFKENLKERLSYLGMYVKELSALSGVKKQTIDSYLSTHNCIPSADAAVAIARVLGVSVEYLISGPETRYDKHGEAVFPHHSLTGTVAQITAQLDEKNQKMVLSIVKAIKKHEDDSKKTEQTPRS